MKKKLHTITYILSIVTLVVFAIVIYMVIKDAMGTRGTYYESNSPDANRFESNWIAFDLYLTLTISCPVYLFVIPQIIYLVAAKKIKEKYIFILLFLLINLIAIGRFIYMLLPYRG